MNDLTGYMTDNLGSDAIRKGTNRLLYHTKTKIHDAKETEPAAPDKASRIGR